MWKILKIYKTSRINKFSKAKQNIKTIYKNQMYFYTAANK